MFELVLPVGVYPEKLEDRFGRFVITPLDRGYGDTIGNSLRRVLLSSTRGAAIVAVRFKDVLHEFSTIPGVLEEVPIIILNLKRVRLKFSDQVPESVEITLNVSKQGEVRAGDLELPTGVEVVNPDEYLFSITGKVKDEVYAEITAMRGRGFVPADEYPESMRGEFPTGTIFVDGIFSPVQRVSYVSENVRVKAAMDKEKLSLDIWTDGTRSPESVFYEAVDIFNKIGQKMSVRLDAPPVPSYEERRLRFEQRQRIKSIIDQPIESLELQKRTLNALKAAGFATIGDLISKTEKYMLSDKVPNFGQKSLQEIREVLVKFDLDFGMDLQEILEQEERM